MNKNFPNEVITSRLVLRRYQLDHIQALYEIVNRNKEDLMDGFPKTVAVLNSPKNLEKYFEEKNNLWINSTSFHYGIWLKDKNIQIGQFQIKNINWEVPSVEPGYFIDKSYRDLGFATEALNKMTTLCFEHGFRRVFLRISPENKPSIKLAEKIGFLFEGTHRNEFRTGRNELADLNYYSMIR